MAEREKVLDPKRISVRTPNLFGYPEHASIVRFHRAHPSAEEATPDGATNTAERLTSHPN